MSVHPVDAERRLSSLSSMPLPNGGHALRLVRMSHARLAALLDDASVREGAFDRAVPGALGAVCFGGAASGGAASGETAPGETTPGETTPGETAPHDRLLAKAAPDLPLAPVHMAMLAPDAGPAARCEDSVYEIWQCDARDLRSVRSGALHYRYSEAAGLVFGSIVIHEAAATHAQDGSPLERATREAYRTLFDVLDTLAIEHPLRIWNTVPAINAEASGIERYRQFNIGRQRAFEACRRTLTGSVPAACALGSVVPLAGDGTPAAPLAIHFLASRTPADSVENPRQVSAYHYPAQYGPRAPTFARAAAWAPDGAAPVLFVSGTASIVGHRTVHHGDAVAQTRETIANLAAVLEQAARQGHGPFTLADLTYTVYVRDPGDARTLAAIDCALRDAAGRAIAPRYLHADVCRADLLVEIEASAGHPVEQLS